MWFYIGSHKPGMPERAMDPPPKYQIFWAEDLLDSGVVDIPELV